MIGRLALLALLAAAPVQAQSVYGCTDLDGAAGMPSVEGDGGVFYRVNPDLRLFHAVSDETIARLARLNAALASLGTTLIYVPLPTKSLAMPDPLPQAARDYGFDPALANTVFDDILRRLRAGGIVAPDIRAALRAAPDAAPSVYPTDYRLTAAGAGRAAQAIAAAMTGTPGFAALPLGRFSSTPLDRVTLPSDMRAILQRKCQITLPEIMVDTFATTQLQASAASDTTLFGAGGAGARVALLGTEHSGEASSNLAGQLSQISGLEVQGYAVPGGGSFAAISTYLTSRSFQEKRPAFVVWVNPVENNLAQFGDQPLAELAAAAGAGCRVPLPVIPGALPGTLTADLTALDRSQPYTLFVDAEGAAASSARFDFTNTAGLVRSRYIDRHPAQVPTGRFYMPLTGLWPEGAQTVTVTLDAPLAATARVTACFD